MKVFLALFIQLVIFQAKASILNDRFILSKDEFYNSLTAELSPEKDPDEKPEDSPGNWNFELGVDYFQSRLQSGDKSQLFRSEFNYLTENWFQWGFGLHFGSASIEKLGLLEGQIILGKIWSFSQNKESDWNPTFSSEFRYHLGAIYKLDSTVTSTGGVTTSDPFTLENRSYELKLESALWEPWKIRGSYRGYQYVQDFSSKVTATNQNRAVAHPFGPLFNSLGNLPSEYATFGVEYAFDPKVSWKVNFAQAKEKLTSDKSQDLHILAQITATSDFNFSWGLGSTQSGNGASPYFLINLNYNY